jgi:hypothetical protein
LPDAEEFTQITPIFNAWKPWNLAFIIVGRIQMADNNDMKTGVSRVTAILVVTQLLSSAAPFAARGASSLEAQKELGTARQKYYQKLRRGEGSPESLANQILKPAEAKVGEAVRKESKEAIAKAVEKVNAEPQIKTSEKWLADKGVDKDGDGDDAGDGKSGNVRELSRSAAPSGGGLPPAGPVLDGSNIPTEMEFPGSQLKAPQAKASPPVPGPVKPAVSNPLRKHLKP